MAPSSRRCILHPQTTRVNDESSLLGFTCSFVQDLYINARSLCISRITICTCDLSLKDNSSNGARNMGRFTSYRNRAVRHRRSGRRRRPAEKEGPPGAGAHDGALPARLLSSNARGPEPECEVLGLVRQQALNQGALGGGEPSLPAFVRTPSGQGWLLGKPSSRRSIDEPMGRAVRARGSRVVRVRT